MKLQHAVIVAAVAILGVSVPSLLFYTDEANLGSNQDTSDIVPEPVNMDIKPEPEPVSMNIKPTLCKPDMSEFASGTNGTIPQYISSTNNDFTLKLYEQLSNDPKQNIFISPFSVYMAFSFLYEGAREDTATQIADAFGFEPDEESRHDYISSTMASVNRDDPHAVLETANAMWLGLGFVPHQEYTDIVCNIYLADIETLDFGGDPKGSADRINDWASNKTRGKIPVVVNPGIVSSAVTILNNAVYFKGTWVTQFDPADTVQNTFWRGHEDGIQTDFMHAKSMFNYTESDAVQVLRMPYEGDRLSMLVILPKETSDITALETSLTADMIRQWNAEMHPYEVAVAMPKFTMKLNYDLKDLLGNLGVPIGYGNFSGITDRGIFIDEVFQDTFVDVNEEGTEAAAVTTIIIREGARPPPIYFTADSPFVFAIQDDESGTILFIGRLSDPPT